VSEGRRRICWTPDLSTMTGRLLWKSVIVCGYKDSPGCRSFDSACTELVEVPTARSGRSLLGHDIPVPCTCVACEPLLSSSFLDHSYKVLLDSGGWARRCVLSLAFYTLRLAAGVGVEGKEDDSGTVRILRVDLAPLFMLTLLLGTPRVLATSSTRQAFALPPDGGAVTLTRRIPSESKPTTSLVGCLVLTLTTSFFNS
jgi:hypothetical protein